MSEAAKAKNNAPPPRWVLKLFTKVNVLVYKLSGGRWMNKLAGMPILLVEMKGARSAKKRTIPLMCVPHGDGFLLVASQGGAPKHPVWYHNLVAYPDVRITFEGQVRAMQASQVSDEEKAQLWPVCCEYYPPYQDYQNLTDRNIPVFLCA
ncbi:MAG: nitroreductase family deazaflavin-dependent oxidoreductase [Candidatus Azotimanducaceae bacterium WSBS_2022_MAG_OTU7]